MSLNLFWKRIRWEIPASYHRFPFTWPFPLHVPIGVRMLSGCVSADSRQWLSLSPTTTFILSAGCVPPHLSILPCLWPPVALFVTVFCFLSISACPCLLYSPTVSVSGPMIILVSVSCLSLCLGFLWVFSSLSLSASTFLCVCVWPCITVLAVHSRCVGVSDTVRQTTISNDGMRRTKCQQRSWVKL